MCDKYLTLTNIDISDIENKIGYCFNDKRLLCKAFTHSSFVNENKNAVSNERLEFFGDRILNFVCAEKLFYSQSGNEGKLTELLINKISKEPLSQTVKKLDIFKYLKKSKGASFSGENPKAESDLFEAVIAAIYVDSGANIRICADFVERNLVDIEIIDYISILKVHCEKQSSLEISEDCKFDEKIERFVCKIVINKQIFEGEGVNKDEAKKNASKKACEFLKI